MKAATLLRVRRMPRPGRRAIAALGFLGTALAGLGWIAWQGSGDPWPARATLATRPGTWPLGFSPDGRTFLTADLAPREMTVTPWDVATGRRGEPWPMPVGNRVPTVAFSPDGRRLATTVINYPSTAKVEVADTATGRPLASFATDQQIVAHLAWSSDGGTLRAYLGDSARIKEVVAWDLATGREASRRPVAVPMRANLAGISPDGRVLVLATLGSLGVDLRDLEADRSLGTLTNPASASPASHAWSGFSADGKTLAIGRRDGSVELWDIPGRKLLKSIPVHARGYSSATIEIAPDGRTLASAAWERRDDSTFGRLWREIAGRLPGQGSELVVVDIATGRALARSPTSMQPLYSPDGRTIATREGGREVVLRDVPPAPR